MALTLPVIYEDEHILAVDKPYGLAVHKVSPTDPQTTLVDLLVAGRPYLSGVGESPLRPGLVHRLDKETSGIILVAKDQPTFLYLKDRFQTRAIKKEYLALVNGSPREPFGVIDAPLGKLGTKQTTQIKGKKELVARDAVTEYRVERTFRDYSLIHVMPKTGRTHQIRVHLKHIGCPLAGDRLYAPKRPLPPGLDRLFLHAFRISFTTPDGKALTLEAPLPEALQRVLNSLQ